MDAPLALLVLPDATRVEHELVRRSRGGQLVDARSVCTLTQLVQQCAASVPGHAVATTALVRAAVTAAALESHDEGLRHAAHTPDFGASMEALLGHVVSQGATPAALLQAADRASPSLRGRAAAVAQVWRARDERLAAVGMVHPSSVLAQARAALETQGLPLSYRHLEHVEVALVHDLPPARLALVKALADACRRQRTRFRLTWSGVGRDDVDLFVAQAVATIEAEWELDADGLELLQATTPLAWVAGEAFADEPRPAEAPALRAFEAVTPRDEVMEVAARVRHLVNDGVAPERIAVVGQNLDTAAPLIEEAFAAVRVPVRARVEATVLASPPARLAASLARLDDEAFPAKAVAQWLTSPWVRGPVACAVDATARLAEAGVRDDAIGRVGDEGAYSVRLGALQRRLHERASFSSNPRWAKAAAEVAQVAASVKALQVVARGIPRRGTRAAMLDAWWRAVQLTGVARSGRPAFEPYDGGLLHRLETHALARDGAAIDALATVYREAREALEQTRLGQLVVTRPAFSQWL
ncbi:MAG: hypothetical protein JNG84_14360, partial [Archangium sp.]|nr:hypothetical protein [Archangium sp.]